MPCLVAMEIKHNITVPGSREEEQLSLELRGSKKIGNMLSTL